MRRPIPAPARSASRGYTLIELTIAMAILVIVVSMVLSTFSAQHKSYTVQDQVLETQQNLRAISDLIESEIRTAGLMVPEAAAVCGLDRTAGSDELYVSDPDPIDPTDIAKADLGARVTTASYSNSGGAQTWTIDTHDLDGDSNFFFDNDSDGTPDSDFRQGGGFILGDANNPDRGNVCGVVRNMTGTTLSVLVVAGSFSGGVAVDADLAVVPASRYHISSAGTLSRNTDVLSMGVDDFQVSYFFDVDDDGLIDTVDPTLENPGTTAGGTYAPQNWNLRELKELRFSVVAIPRSEDDDYTQGGFITTGNRVDPGTGNDGFRRRVYTSRVRPRNIGLRSL